MVPRHRARRHGRTGEDPVVIDAFAAALAWQVISVSSSMRDTCTQRNAPPTRSPVSSNPATGAAVICSRTRAQNSSSRPATRPVTAATVPGDTAVPNNSDNAWAARYLDRNWPTYRYTMIAWIRSPYWTLARTCPGAAVVTTTHPQRRDTSRCSVTCTLIGGRSNTCRRSYPTGFGTGESRPAATAHRRFVLERLMHPAQIVHQRQRRSRMSRLPTRAAASLAA